jgi:hypothetical protein
MQTKTIFERVWRNVFPNNNGCWEYYGGYTDRDYGHIWYQGELQGVHRVVYKLMKGKIPLGLYVLHECDNPRCCNPDHLFLGTAQDNTLDMIAKNRHGWRRI